MSTIVRDSVPEARLRSKAFGCGLPATSSRNRKTSTNTEATAANEMSFPESVRSTNFVAGIGIEDSPQMISQSNRASRTIEMGIRSRELPFSLSITSPFSSILSDLSLRAKLLGRR